MNKPMNSICFSLRFLCLFVLMCSTIKSQALDWSDPNFQTNSHSELLKAFIQSPPQNGEMLFQFSSSFVPGNQSGVVKHNYRSVWNGTNYFIMRLATLDFYSGIIPTNILEIAGMYEGRPWYYMINKGVLKTSIERLEDSTDMDVKKMHDLFWSKFASARAFGVLHAPGSFLWNGNEFHATSFDNIKLTGALGFDASGEPVKFHFSGIVKDQRVGGTVNLSYEGKSAAFPDSYGIEVEIGTNRIPFAEVHFRSISVINNIPPKDFDPHVVIANLSKPTLNLVSSNSTLFYLNKNSQLVTVAAAGQEPVIKSHRSFIIFCMIAISLVTCFLGWKFTTKRN